MSTPGVSLFAYDSKGKVRTWKASLSPQGDTIDILIEHGVLDGKMQTKVRTVKSGKNIGKKNETSLEEQALLELGYLYTKQLDSGYVYNILDYAVPKRPQLAYKYSDKKHTVKFYTDEEYELNPHVPLLYTLSRKLNGIRCFIFADYSDKQRYVSFESRTGKLFKFFTHLDEELALKYSTTFRKVIFDVELFHPDIPFEILCSLVNSDEYCEVLDENTGVTWKTSDVQAHCYDIVDQENVELSYEERFLNSGWYTQDSDVIKLVENVPVYTEAQLVSLATQWIAEGDEGAMLRNIKAAYDFGARTVNLLKYKVMLQEEFQILKLYLAENDQEKVMATVANHHSTDPEYNTFECSLKGSKADNMKLYLSRDSIEKQAWLTIDYQVLSSYNVPLFPVGVVIRKGTLVNGVFVPEV